MYRHTSTTTMSLSVITFVILAIIVATSNTVSAQSKSKQVIVDIKARLLFDVTVMRNQKKPYIVYYYSSSECPPCKWSLLPMIEKMVRRKEDSLNMAMVDFDKVPELRDEHGISAIPTVMVFFKGEILDIVEGKSWSPIVAAINRAANLVE